MNGPLRLRACWSSPPPPASPHPLPRVPAAPLRRGRRAGELIRFLDHRPSITASGEQPPARVGGRSGPSGAAPGLTRKTGEIKGKRGETGKGVAGCACAERAGDTDNPPPPAIRRGGGGAVAEARQLRSGLLFAGGAVRASLRCPKALGGRRQGYLAVPGLPLLYPPRPGRAGGRQCSPAGREPQGAGECCSEVTVGRRHPTPPQPARFTGTRPERREYLCECVTGLL